MTKRRWSNRRTTTITILLCRWRTTITILFIPSSHVSGRGFNKFKKHYKLKGELGRGGFGIVYRAVRVADELPVAVKFIDRRTVREWGKVFRNHYYIGLFQQYFRSIQINDEQVPMEICMLAKCSKIRGEYSSNGKLVQISQNCTSVHCLRFVWKSKNREHFIHRYCLQKKRCDKCNKCLWTSVTSDNAVFRGNLCTLEHRFIISKPKTFFLQMDCYKTSIIGVLYFCISAILTA